MPRAGRFAIVQAVRICCVSRRSGGNMSVRLLQRLTRGCASAAARSVTALAAAGLLAASCGGLPGGPGSVPAELEGMLLTSEEVGGDFVEEYRGKVTFDVAGSLWPAGREAAGEALEVLSSESTSGSASFVSPLPPEYTGAEPGDAVLQQQVLTADADEIEAGMAALRAGLARSATARPGGSRTSSTPSSPSGYRTWVKRASACSCATSPTSLRPTSERGGSS